MVSGGERGARFSLLLGDRRRLQVAAVVHPVVENANKQAATTSIDSGYRHLAGLARWVAPEAVSARAKWVAAAMCRPDAVYARST